LNAGSTTVGYAMQSTGRMKRIVLVNPNTSATSTALMLAIARDHLAKGFTLEGATAVSGPPLITNPEQLRMAGDVIAGMGASLARHADGIIVSGFGDPGAEELRRMLSVPVIGIAEAAMREAAGFGVPFSVVTTTPALLSTISSYAEKLGCGSLLASVHTTEGSPEDIMSDGELLVDELERIARLAVNEHGAQTIIVGGGPLATAAAALRDRMTVRMVEPIPAAMRRMTADLLQ
jgi:Asp/Glu/hydantoin racemase